MTNTPPRENKEGPRLLFDIETDGLLASVSKLHCIVTINLDTKEQLVFTSADNNLQEGLDLLTSARELIGHNIIDYDIRALKKLYSNLSFDNIRLVDTLMVSRVLYANIMDRDVTAEKQGKRELFRGEVVQHTLPSFMFGRHSLEAWGHRLGVHKGDYSAVMKAQGKDPWASFNDDMLRYCIDDVLLNLKLLKLFGADRPDRRCIDLENYVQSIMLKQEEHGFGFDERAAFDLYAQLSEKRRTAEENLLHLFKPWYAPELGWTDLNKTEAIRTKFRTTRAVGVAKYGKSEVPQTGARGQPIKPKLVWNVLEYQTEGEEHTPVTLTTFNPSSRMQVSDRLKTLYNWVPTEFTDTGQPKIDDDILEALGNSGVAPAKVIAESYMLEKRLSQLGDGAQAWLKCVRNGRIHHRVTTNGAITGRATHSKPNLAQVPSIANARGKVPYGKECRALFKPPTPGFVQVGADASGLELRCLAHYMAEFDNGDYGRVLLEGDIHWTNTISMGLFPDGTIKDDSNPLHKNGRANAKTFIYAFLYGAGPEKIGSITGVSPEELEAWGTDRTIITQLQKNERIPTPALVATIRKGREMMAMFLKKTPALMALRKWVDHQYKTNHQRLEGLDGRPLYCRSSHSALNTLLQSAGAILCKRWLVEMDNAFKERGWIWGKDYAQLAWVHDEVQIECRPEIAEELGDLCTKCVTLAGEYFDFKIPLAGDYKVGSSWADCH